MTCAAFADLLVDLAREAPIEAAVRASALEHAAACRDCGERLAEQRMLTARLSELAAFDARDAPAWIETSLRARLRAKGSDAAPLTSKGQSASRIHVGERQGVRGVRRSTEPIDNEQSANRIHFGEREGGQGGATRYQPASHELRERRDSLPTRTRGVQGGVTQHPPAQRRRWAWASVAAASAVLAVMSLLTAERGTATLPHPTAAPAAAAADDGSFLALPYGDSLADLDAVQVMRVQVQPTALASLGWTVGAEARNPVEAELLVGQDGIARGIRFVE